MVSHPARFKPTHKTCNTYTIYNTHTIYNTDIIYTQYINNTYTKRTIHTFNKLTVKHTYIHTYLKLSTKFRFQSMFERFINTQFFYEI